MAQPALDALLSRFRDLGDEVAFVQRAGYRAVHWSYGRVAETAWQVAHEMHTRGIAKGDRILLWGPNCAEWVAVFWGCVAMGIVVVPMDDAASPDFASRVFAQVQAKAAVCSRERATVFDAPIVLEDIPSAVAGRPVDGTGLPLQPAVSTDTLEIVFTSGTTAEPKGVLISHGNVLANIAPLEAEASKYLKYEKLVHPVRFLTLLPLSHVFGQFLGIFLPQLLGGTVIFQETLKPADIVATIRRERVSVLVAVPKILQSLRERIERDAEETDEAAAAFRKKFQAAGNKHFLRRWWTFRRVHDQFGWKFWAFVSGGAALDRETEEFWGRLGYAVIQGYGLTETTSLISLNHPFRLGKGSIGKVLPGREVRLAEDGEILVRGGGVASGYWGAEEPVAGDQGWYRTGDIGELDDEGHLYFKGRKKEVIVTSAGMNVHAADLEAALRRQPEVKDCVVLPLPRKGNAEACAVLLLRPDAEDPEPAVRRANQMLAEHQRMRTWLVWPEEDFPRTSTHKPRTAEIRRFVEDRMDQIPAGPTGAPLGELIARIARHPVNGLSRNSNLESDLNLSSLDRVELLGALEDRYQLDLSETSFSAVSTVGQLERMLRGEVPARARYHYPRWVLERPVNWIRTAAYHLLIRPAVSLLGRPQVIGPENLNGIHGPVLVICNHLGDFDLGFVLAALPPRIREKLATATGGEALEALRTPPPGRNFAARTFDRVKWFLGVSLLNLFPLPREAGFRESFAYAGEAMDRGYSVLVFPEGRYTPDGKLLPFRSGIGLLAKNLAVPVVPLRIDGLFEVQQAGERVAPPGKIKVKIGMPVTCSVDDEPEKIAADLRRRVEEL